MDQDDRLEVNYGAHVLWKPTDSLTLELQGNHIDQEGTPNPVLNISDRHGRRRLRRRVLRVLRSMLRRTRAVAVGRCAGRRSATASRISSSTSDTYIGQVNWDISDQYQLTYIGAYHESFDDTAFDFDGSPSPLYHARKPGDYTQRSHELRITRDHPIFSGQAGVYFWNADSYTINIAPALFDRAWTKSESFSVYGETDFRFAEHYVLTTGLPLHRGGQGAREVRRRRHGQRLDPGRHHGHAHAMTT